MSSISQSSRGYNLGKTLKLTTSGTYTPTGGTRAIKFTLKGGGGGSGGFLTNGGSGGGGEGCTVVKLETSIASSYVYTIGAGGVAGAATPTAGSAGGDTTINGITANGGGGSLGATGIITAGGSGSNSFSGTPDYSIKGQSGSPASFVGTSAIGGVGGGQGGGLGNRNGAGVNGVDGGGAGGVANTSGSGVGAVGGGGYIIVEEYF